MKKNFRPRPIDIYKKLPLVRQEDLVCETPFQGGPLQKTLRTSTSTLPCVACFFGWFIVHMVRVGLQLPVVVLVPPSFLVPRDS